MTTTAASEQKQTGILKGGEFIIRDQSPDEVFIPEELNEEQRMIQQTCADFAREAGDDLHKLDKQALLMEKAGALGLLGAHIPEKYSGLGFDNNTNTLISEELGRNGGSFNTTFAAHIGIGMLPVLYFGTEEQKQKYLPPMVSGEMKAAYCLTEPGSGSDALAAKTRADLSEDGKHYILNGQKMWISNAGFADVFIVFAKINGEDFTGFIVEAGLEGLTLGDEEEKMGIKGSSTRQVFFENVKVPVENLLGEQGKGHLIAFNTLNIGRFKLGVMTMGGMKQCIETGAGYALDREQFGKPIAEFGAIRYKIAQQSMLTYVLESTVYRVSQQMQVLKESLLEQGHSFEEAMLLSAKEYAVECAMIKVFGSESLSYVVDELVQIYGGYGFSEEYPAARAYRDARINRIYEGTNEINRLLMVNQILKRAFKGDLDLVGPAWDVQKELTQLPSREKPEGELGEEKKAIQNFKKILLMVAGAAAKYQMDGKHDLREEQQIVMQIADIATDVYVCESALLRLQKLVSTDHEHAARAAVIIRLCLHEAQHRIQRNAQDCLASFATGDELTIMLKGVKRFSKYPLQNVKELREEIAEEAINAKSYPLS